MPFVTAKYIDDAYYRDEFKLFIVYGPLGIGKSSYSIKVMAELLGGDYAKVKDYIVFHPEDFLARCLKLAEHKKREKAIIWNDAGLWLFAFDFKDPFIKALVKYMNVARTNWGAMILTTPAPNWILFKLRSFPQSYNIKIIKLDDDFGHKKKYRRAIAYQNWVMPDFKHTGVRQLWTDDFDAMLPHDFYWDFYKPLRETYAHEAAVLAKKEFEKIKDKLGKDTVQLLEQIVNSL